MENIYPVLEQYRLHTFYNKFLEIGVKDVRDFIDSIDDEIIESLGLSQVEKRRFADMQTHIKRLGSSSDPLVNVNAVKKQTEVFRVTYRYPKCSEPKEICDMDPSQNTLEDLMLRIGFQEKIGNDKAVCLYSVEGMPLTDDPFFNTWCLNDRHIENGSELYALFTPKKNLRLAAEIPCQVTGEIPGPDTVRCHIMLKGEYEVNLDLDKDTLGDLTRKLSNESGIPAHVLCLNNIFEGPGQSLKSLEISSQSLVRFTLSSFDMKYTSRREFFTSDITPSVDQTQRGKSAFFSTLYSINMQCSQQLFLKVIAYIRKLTGCNALAQALYELMCRNEFGTRNQKIAIVEGLYLLFRELLPSLTKRNGPQIIEDPEVYEHSPICWAYLMSQAENKSSEQETYATISLVCEGSENRLCEPVRVPGIHSVFDREFILAQIEAMVRIPGCSEEELKESSIQRATDVERILLSLPQARKFPLWTSKNYSSGHNFKVNPEMTFDEMAEGVSVYPHLLVTPPLQLKDLGMTGPHLVYITADNLCVYISKCKDKPTNVQVFDCLAGMEKTVDVVTLATQLGDSRTDNTFRINRVPQEAILALVDSSSSMSLECYESRQRIEAVKELFLSFIDRTTAYDFPHIVGLVKFGLGVNFNPFTDSMDTFESYVKELQASGNTPLYDALNLGLSELQKVKRQFPDCRLRMLCFTDGHDQGSKSDPVAVAVKLINANIVVDSIVLGEQVNTVLHGISNATGGCCFKPKTGKEALQLLQIETVLSLERRKLKKKFQASSIQTLDNLTKMFQTCGFDDKPEVALPEELNNKVTLTQNALKKRIQESKTGKFMERDKRILEELKSLHCDPHPYCTVLPSETNFRFWKILMNGPPNTPYKKGVFELYCQFGDEYPLKPPLVRFLTPIYHCNVNSVGRICHNIFDRNYSAHVTMKEILDAVFGLLIAPEPEDPLDSVLAEEFLSSPEKYVEQAQKNTAQAAATSMEDIEKQLVGEDLTQVCNPAHLICRLSKKMFVDPVITPYGDVYERGAIEKALETRKMDPFNNKPLDMKDLKPSNEMKTMGRKHRLGQI